MTLGRRQAQLTSLEYLPRMGFLSRLFIPRRVRRAAHPVRGIKRAATPKSVKRLRRSLSPIDNAVYSVERSLTTRRRGKGHSQVYHHGACPVKHRTPEAAQRCRNA